MIDMIGWIAALGFVMAAALAVWAFRLKGAEAASQQEMAVLKEKLAGREAAYTELKNDLAERDAQISGLQDEVVALKVAQSESETARAKEREAADEKLLLIREERAQLTDTFKSLSLDALQGNSASFLDLAKATLEKFQETAKGDLDTRQQAIGHLVEPIKVALEKFDIQIKGLETTRETAYQGLSRQVSGLSDAQRQWQAEAAGLTKALTAPRAGGRWGEMQLRRVVELAGMVAHCDFTAQQGGGDTTRLIPDLVIQLPGGRQIVVDAKAPVAAYHAACEASDETIRKGHLQDHARRVREHMKQLGGKAYWSQFRPSPEFVFLFLPAESFFSAALLEDPSLIEQGVSERVILATPTTLIALLKAVSYGWQQEKATQNAEEIRNAGRELYERLCTMIEHLAGVGKGLDQATQRYNAAIGSLEARVLPSARRIQEMGAGTGKAITPPAPVDTATRLPQPPEVPI